MAPASAATALQIDHRSMPSGNAFQRLASSDTLARYSEPDPRGQPPQRHEWNQEAPGKRAQRVREQRDQREAEARPQRRRQHRAPAPGNAGDATGRHTQREVPDAVHIPQRRAAHGRRYVEEQASDVREVVPGELDRTLADVTEPRTEKEVGGLGRGQVEQLLTVIELRIVDEPAGLLEDRAVMCAKRWIVAHPALVIP